MLISRLETKIETLEREKKILREGMKNLAAESAAKIYILEGERDEALRKVRQLEQDLALERHIHRAAKK